MESVAIQQGTRLAEYGLLGILLIICLGVIVFLYRKAETKDQSRITELLKVVEAAEGFAKALRENTIALEAMNRTIESRTRATEALERAVSDLTKARENSDNRIIEKVEEIRRVAALYANPQGR